MNRHGINRVHNIITYKYVQCVCIYYVVISNKRLRVRAATSVRIYIFIV